MLPSLCLRDGVTCRHLVSCVFGKIKSRTCFTSLFIVAVTVPHQLSHVPSHILMLVSTSLGSLCVCHTISPTNVCLFCLLLPSQCLTKRGTCRHTMFITVLIYLEPLVNVAVTVPLRGSHVPSFGFMFVRKHVLPHVSHILVHCCRLRASRAESSDARTSSTSLRHADRRCQK